MPNSDPRDGFFYLIDYCSVIYYKHSLNVFSGCWYKCYLKPSLRLESVQLILILHISSSRVTLVWKPSLGIWAVACDFQQCGVLTSVDSDKPVQPHFKLRNSKWCSVSSLTLIEYASDKQRLWSDRAYALADLRLCWSHIPHCWKSHVVSHFLSIMR